MLVVYRPYRPPALSYSDVLLDRDASLSSLSLAPHRLVIRRRSRAQGQRPELCENQLLVNVRAHVRRPEVLLAAATVFRHPCTGGTVTLPIGVIFHAAFCDGVVSHDLSIIEAAVLTADGLFSIMRLGTGQFVLYQRRLSASFTIEKRHSTNNSHNQSTPMPRCSENREMQSHVNLPIFFVNASDRTEDLLTALTIYRVAINRTIYAILYVD